MKRPRLKGRWPWCGLLLVPFLGWILVLALVPTEWAKTRLVDRLTALTGRSVKIGSLRLGMFGNLRIIDLSIAEPRVDSDPWLRVGEARIDVHLGQILLGHCEPKEINVDGLVMRVWRRKDGTPELGDLLRDRPQADLTNGPGKSASPAQISLKIKDSTLRVIDEPSGSHFDLTDVQASATYGQRLASLDQLKATLNGGTFEMAAKLDRDPILPRFQAEVRASNVEIDQGIKAIGALVPVADGPTNEFGGKITLRVDVKGQGTTKVEVRRSLRGSGSIALDPIDLNDSRFFNELNVLGDWPPGSRVGTVTSDFMIDQGRFNTESLTIRISEFPFVLAGWTDFDGRFDFHARPDLMLAKLPRESRAWLADYQAHMDQLAGLRVQGNRDHVGVTINGRPLTGDPTRPDDERTKFRETARRIRDHFFH